MIGALVEEGELKTLVVDQLGLLDDAEFEKARAMAGRLKVPIERAVAERGRFPFGFLLEQLGQAWGVAYTELKVSDVQHEALKTVREEFARNHLVVPFEQAGPRLKVAMVNPRDRVLIRELEQLTRLEVVPVLAPEGSIRRALLLYKPNLRDLLARSTVRASTDVTRRPAAPAGPGQTAKAQWVGAAVTGPTRMQWSAGSDASEIVTRILEYGIVTRASDIHVEPYEMELLVRYRIDGVLHEVLSFPPAAHAPVTARIKILSAMRIDEHRLAQDGRFEAELSGFKSDLRVSTIPTQWGEKVVLRVLSREAAEVDLDDLGLAASDHEVLLRNLLRPHGMILVTGPTGSGKSTSLYAMLRRLALERNNAVNISTIEDPIEYNMPRVNQIPLNAAAGFGFADALRALLRQDPDIIMVGEIRDAETLEIGVRAALVGRLLLSTLHTNDAPAAVPRLLDMWVEPFLLSSTLALVVAQRLARRICIGCRESVTVDPSTLRLLRARPDFDRTIELLCAQGVLGSGADPLAGARTFQGRGCQQCRGSGFLGRVGIFELLEVDDEIRQLIMARQNGGVIQAAATAGGMRSMFGDGLAKAFLGDTTLAEVLRVVS